MTYSIPAFKRGTQPFAAAHTASRQPRRAIFGATLGLLGLGILSLGILGLTACNPAPASDPPDMLREIGSRLASVGVNSEAARYYSQYVENPAVPPDKRAAVGLVLARLLKEDGQLESALAYLYRVEQWAPDSPAAKDAAPLIVEVLDKLGKGQAAETALKSRSQLKDSGPGPSQNGSAPREGAVVARIEGKDLTTADLDAAIAELPPQLQGQLKSPEGKRSFLQQFVAQELLYQKGLKRNLDKEPDVRRQIDALSKQVVVSRLLESEASTQVKPSEQDLRNFYQAHADRFKDKDGKVAPFEQIQGQVGQLYLMSRVQELSQSLLKQALDAQEVQVFPEAIGADVAADHGMSKAAPGMPSAPAPVPAPAPVLAPAPVPAPAPAGGHP